ITLDHVTVLRPTQPMDTLTLGETWSGLLHLPRGLRTRKVPVDLCEHARTKCRNLDALDEAELRYALTYLGEATNDRIRRGRIDMIVSALPMAKEAP
ncbi:MAG: hypothetical protein ACRDQZ_05785, partial [Mycobacteriales bacterium]